MTVHRMLPNPHPQHKTEHHENEGAKNIALLQDFGRTHELMPMHEFTGTDISASVDLTKILASALNDETTFAQLFPDDLLQNPDTAIHGACLPGLRQNDTGRWTHVEPGDASVSERREYIRRNLVVSCAHKIIAVFDRQKTQLLAVTQLRTAHTLCCLTSVANDVCNHFEPIPQS